MKKLIFLLLFVLALSSTTGCGTFSVSTSAITAADATATRAASDEITATVEYEPEPTITTTLIPSEPSTPTPEPATALLPAPLYYLNPADNQVWRVEPDGVTLTQISQEAEPVEQYDVNPVDGSVALLSDNDLIVTDALGQDRRVIVDGRSEEEVGVHWYLTDRLSNPVWSADGQQLAYGLNGINFYEVASATSRIVVPNDPLPAENEPQRGVHVYTPNSFSPDGTFLLLMVGWYQSGGGVPSVLRLNTAAPLVELQGAGFPCCTFRWSQDGSTILSANHSLGMFQPGLWRSDPATGETETIMASDTGGDEIRVFNWPQDLGAGQIAVFYGEGPPSAYEQGLPRTMALVNVDLGAGMISGRHEGEWMPGEASWLQDGSGVALTDIPDQAGGGWPLTGTLTYLSLAGDQVVELPVSGHTLHWGPLNG